MGTSLTGNNISQSYLGLLKSTDSQAISSTVKRITDGNGNDLPLSISTSTVRLQSGTSTAPSLSFGSNSEGFYVPSDENVGFVIAGSEKIRLNSDGLSILNSKITLNNDQKIRWSSDDVYIQGTTATDNIQIGLAGSTKLTLHQTNGLTLAQYGSGSITGTVTQRLGVTSSGQVVEIPIGAGALDGSGTAGKLAKFTDSDTLGDSIISESSNTITVTGDVRLPYDASDAKFYGQDNGNIGFGKMIPFDANGFYSFNTNFTLANGGYKFLYNGSEKMRLDSSGNLIVGGTSASSKLHIEGAITSKKDDNVLLVESTNAGQSSLDLKNTEGHYRLITDGGELKVFDQTDSRTPFLIDTSGNSTFTGGTIIKSNGIVYLGFTDNTAIGGNKLEVNGNIYGGGNLTINEGDAFTDLNIKSNRTGTSDNIGGLNFVNNSDAIKSQIFADRAGNIKIASGGQSLALTIDSSQNVGIGTSSPTSVLQVKKNSATSDVLIESDTLALLQLKDTDLDKTYNVEIGRSASAGDLTFRSSTGEKVRFTEDGNVGIGTASPGANLQIGSATHAPNSNLTNNLLQIKSPSGFGFITIGNGDTANSTSYIGGASGLTVFGTVTDAGVQTEHIRIFNDGTVGIGTTSPSAKLHIIDTTNPATTSGSLIVEGRRDGGANVLSLRAKDASNPSDALPNGQGAVMRFQGFDGTDFENMGYIFTGADGQAVANGDAPSFMAFGTTPNNSGTPSERLRITSGGLVGIGNSNPQNTLHLGDNSASSAGVLRIDSFVANQFWKLEPGTNTLNIKDYDGNSLLSLNGADNSATFTGDVTINSTTSTLHLKGSNTGASLINFADSDDGNVGRIYYDHSNNFMQFKTNDSEKMRITGAGLVGIGTTSASQKLHIKGSGDQAVFVENTGTFQNFLGIASNEGYVGSSNATPFYIKTNGSKRLYVDTSGNVGISTDSPSEKLEVDGNIKLSSNANFIKMVRNSGSAVIDVMGFESGTDTLVIKGGSTGGTAIKFKDTTGDVMAIHDSKVGIGTTSPSNGKLQIDSSTNQISIETGTSGDGRLHIGHFANGTFIGTYGDDGGAGDLIRFGTHSGDERMRITSAGNVGIGTSSPSTLISNSSVRNASASGLSTSLKGLNIEVPAGTDSQGYVASFANTQTASSNFNAGVLIEVGSTDTTTRLLSVESGGTNRFEVRGDGNVGIGTASPSTNLHISSATDTIVRITSADGSTAVLDLGDVSDPDGGRVFYDSGSNLGFTTQSIERMRIRSTGVVEVNSQGGADALERHQTFTMNCTAGNSGVSKAFVTIGDTCSLDFHVIVKDSADATNVGVMRGNVSVANDTADVDSMSSSFSGNVTGISAGYSSTTNTLTLTCTYALSTPVVFIAVNGISNTTLARSGDCSP